MSTRPIFALVLLLTLAASASAQTDSRAWIRDLYRAETAVASAIRTGDAGEMGRQRSALSRLLGNSNALTGEATARLACVSAGQSLFNLTLDLTADPPRTARAPAEAKRYSEAMTRCEKGYGAPNKRLVR